MNKAEEKKQEIVPQQKPVERDWFQRPAPPSSKAQERNSGTDWSGADWSGSGLYRGWGSGREK